MESVDAPASIGTALTTGTASESNGLLLRFWLVLVEGALRFNASGEVGEAGEAGEEGSRRFLSLSRLFGLVRDFFPSGVVSFLSPNSSKTFVSWSAPSS